MAKKQNPDLFGEDSETRSSATGSEDFASLFGRQDQIQKLRVGQLIQGEILSLGKDQSFISTGTPTDGVIPSADLRDEKGEWKYKKGEWISVKVVAMKGGEILLRKEGAKSSSQGEDGVNLEDAFDMELPVEGKVVEAVKGGFRVKIGSQTGFCPLSQIDLRVDKDHQIYVGKKYDFQVIEYAEEGRKIVLSRKKILAGQKMEAETDFLSSAKVGDQFDARVTRIEKYGAFVELEDGVQGLVPISEMAWGRVENPSDLLSIGQTVKVQMMKAEEDGDRIKVSFSIKQAGGGADPWTLVTEKYKVGQPVQGPVVRKEVYGLFVQLEPGVTALFPKSKWRDSVDAKEFENKKKGDLVQARIDQINFEEKKISLGPAGESDSGDWQSFSSSPQKLGTFGDLFSKMNVASKSESKSDGKKK